MLRWLAVLAVVALLAAACGRSDDSNASGDDDGGSKNATSTTQADKTGNFGDLEHICGPAPEGTTLEATDTGVTPTSVQVSVFSDPGFSGRPGLNQEMFDSAEAFTDWCNAEGGIYGRKIVLKKRDAKLTEFQQRVIEACQEKDFMMVGGGAVFDDTGQKERLACGLPNIAGYVVTGTAAAADLTYQPVPNPIDKQPIGDYIYLGKKFPEATQKIGVVTGAIATTVQVAKRNEEAVTKPPLNWKVIYRDQYNPQGEANWRPKAEGLKNAGVKGLIWVGEPVNLANFMKALSDIGYKLDFARSDANHYDPLLLSEGGAAVNGTYVRSVFYPFLTDEEAAKNPATEQYRTLLKKYVPNGKIAYLGVQGWSAWLLFAQAATECGADLTRDCVWANIAKIKDWTGGGLHAAQDVATTTPGDCYALELADNGKFTLADINPNEGIYSCDPGNVVTLTGDYGTGAKCPNPKFADDPKPSNCAS